MTVTGSAAFEDKNVGTDKTVNYTSVALSGEEAGNYTIAETATGLGTISKSDVTISVNDYTREYNGGTDASGATLKVVSGEIFTGDSMSGGTKNFDTKNADGQDHHRQRRHHQRWQ